MTTVPRHRGFLEKCCFFSLSLNGNVVTSQGDQIGRNFAQWVIVYFAQSGMYMKIRDVSHILGDSFPLLRF
jgi:hypothetical protein